MEVFVILTDGESTQTREKDIEESNHTIATMARFKKVGTIGCE